MAPAKGTKKRRFDKIAEASRVNMQVAVDFILLHNQSRVRGRQIQGSLNQTMVLVAAGAWERFVADTKHAFTVEKGWFTPGRNLSSVRGAFSAAAQKRLHTEASACSAFGTHWSAIGASNWRGRTITPETLHGDARGKRTGLALWQHLDQWVELRNALAHQQVDRLASIARDARRWRDNQRRMGGTRKDPYATPSGQRRLLWDSDASKPTLQTGAARAAVALFIQVLDYVIVDVAAYNNSDPEPLRLPAEWFGVDLPERYRGLTVSDLDFATLWGGTALHRHPT